MKVVIVDVRNGNVHSDCSNLDVPDEGREAMMEAIAFADVLVEIGIDGIVWVRRGVEHGVVTLIATKSEPQLSMEKALREKAARAKSPDDLVVGEHPVDVKFVRVWDGTVESGKPVEGGLRGY